MRENLVKITTFLARNIFQFLNSQEYTTFMCATFNFLPFTTFISFESRDYVLKALGICLIGLYI